jgi:hypothetical protein
MSERPQELERIDQIMRAAAFAHELVFDRHRKLLDREPDREDTTPLLAESARIATVELPRLIAPLRSLSARWIEQSLLDPEAAASTVKEIAEGLTKVEPEVRSMTERLGEILSGLRGLLDS